MISKAINLIVLMLSLPASVLSGYCYAGGEQDFDSQAVNFQSAFLQHGLSGKQRQGLAPPALASSTTALTLMIKTPGGIAHQAWQ
ncbi:MAG: hypothetical protein ACR2PT_12760 [Endozoicomonas sp.]